MLHSHPPYRLLSDERLARLAAGRDDRAFSSLYMRYEPALLAYCRSITRDAEDARDALQNAMTSAYAAAPVRGDGSGPVRAWLFRIAHNESVNVLRRRRPELPLVDGDLRLVPSAAEQTTEREAAHEALAEVAQLPPRQRGAFVLRELHGLEYREIAAALSVTEVNARQLVFAARSGVADSRAGAALPCDLVRDAIEAGDRRAQRRRPLRAHLRSCDDCRAYARISHARPRRAMLALPGGWLAGWTPFVSGGGTSVSGGAELFTPAKAAVIVAVAAAATGAATHQHARPESASHPRVAIVADARAATLRASTTSASTTSASTTTASTTSAPTSTRRATRASGSAGPAASTRLSPSWRGVTPSSRGTSQRHSAPDDEFVPVRHRSDPGGDHGGRGDDWRAASGRSCDRDSAGAGGDGSVPGDSLAGDGDHPVAARVDGVESSGQVASLDRGDQLGVGGT